MKLRKRKPSKEVTAQSGAGSSDEDFIDASLPESSRRTSAKRSRKAESPTTASPAQAKRRKPTVAQSEPGEGRRGGNAGPEPSPSLSKQTRGAGGSNRDSQEGKEQFAEGCGKRCNKSYGHPPVSIQDKEREKLTQEILTGYGASSKRAKTESSSSSQPVPSPPKKPRPADPFLTSFFSASASSSQPRPNPIAEPVPAPPVQSTDSSQSVNAASSVINSFAESDSDDDEIWEEVGIDDDDERVGVNAADPAESSDERNFNLPVVEGASKGHFEIIIPKSNVETNDK
ncbi:hypothetical protein HK104_005045 [Borealophlyctis nickersoniae]|nr:hypothetical protein HK104_005045 [Borealophlyctis nickersoniae]